VHPVDSVPAEPQHSRGAHRQSDAEWFEARRALDQTIPVVVTDLVAKMAEQRAIGFVHAAPALFALGVVGLGQVDANHTVFVPRQHARRGRVVRVGHELERQSAHRVVGVHRDYKDDLKVRSLLTVVLHD
jgi:hypothetical protein